MRFEVRDRKVSIVLNDQVIHQLEYQENAGRVAGLRFLFTGNGEVEEVRLWSAEGKLVFGDGVNE